MIVTRTPEILKKLHQEGLSERLVISDAFNESMKDLKRETNLKLCDSYRNAGKVIVRAPEAHKHLVLSVPAGFVNDFKKLHAQKTVEKNRSKKLSGLPVQN